MQIGASIHGKYEYVFVDGNMEKDPWSVIANYLETGDFKYFGTTVMPGPQLNQAIPYASRAKKLRPDLINIWGGYFAANQYKTVCKAPYIGMGAPVLAMYLSYEGDRGYLPADYITNKITPKVPGIIQMGQKMVGEYEWTVVESANSEWHVASIENGKWLLVVENTKAVNEQAMSILETALASVPYIMSETSPVDETKDMETATETTVFEK